MLIVCFRRASSSPTATLATSELSNEGPVRGPAPGLAALPIQERYPPMLASFVSRPASKTLVVALLMSLAGAGPALAQCGNDAAGFDRWLGQFKGEAAAQGISATGMRSAW